MTGNFTNITLAAPTTTTVRGKKGTLHKIIVNKAAANGVITVYDGTAAQAVVIATITSPATLLQNHFVLEYNCQVKNGITVVTSGAQQDVTITSSGEAIQ